MNMLSDNRGGEHRLDFSPHRLWSLWDMLKVSARHYIELGETIADISTNLMMADTMARDDPEQGLRPDEVEHMRQNLIKIWDVCNELGLHISGDLISSRVDASGGKPKLPQTQGEWDLLVDGLRSEIQNRLFVFIPEHRAKYFDKEVSWRPAFPEAATDFQSAYKCLAAGEPTAAVFHAMRSLEHGLHALVDDLQVSLPKPIETLQWANILDQIVAEIKRRRGEKGGAEDPKIEFWSNAASNFFVFKEAWRNKVTHARVTYQEGEGEKIVNAVDDVMNRLATQLTAPSGTLMGLTSDQISSHLGGGSL